eukprot:scaffold104039_cov61-Phaeocystis_antarctica.AAC.4
MPGTCLIASALKPDDGLAIARLSRTRIAASWNKKVYSNVCSHPRSVAQKPTRANWLSNSSGWRTNKIR